MTRKCEKEMPQSPHVTNGSIQNDQEMPQPQGATYTRHKVGAAGCNRKMPQPPHVTKGNIQNDQEMSQPNGTAYTRHRVGAAGVFGKYHNHLTLLTGIYKMTRKCHNHRVQPTHVTKWARRDIIGKCHKHR